MRRRTVLTLAAYLPPGLSPDRFREYVEDTILRGIEKLPDNEPIHHVDREDFLVEVREFFVP